MIEFETQALVIGSGFGGGVAASRLLDKGYQVTMLERGPWRNTVPTTSMNVRQAAELPRKNWWQLFSKSFYSLSDWRLPWHRGLGFNRRTGAFELINQPKLFSMCTSQVGGGSLVWGGVIHRPIKDDYWENRAEGVSEAAMAPHYEQVSRELGASVMGDGQEVPDNWSRTWSGVEELDFSVQHQFSSTHRLPGRPENTDLEWGIERRESSFQAHMTLGCLDGSKASTDAIYVGPALARGMTLLSNCEALSISQAESGKAGFRVEAKRTDTGETVLIHCEKLLLGAGTYNTVRLLLEAQSRGALETMPALGQGISGNGDEASLMWNVHEPGRRTPRRGLASAFRLRHGRQDLQHAFMETDLPDTRVPILRSVVRKLNNSLLLASMGIDRSDGHASWRKNRLHLDFDPALSQANIDGEQEHREIGSLLGFKVLLSPKRLTVHMSGGACVGHTNTDGVVDGKGEVWGNEGLYVVDAAAIPEAPGNPPTLNIAAWAAHVVSSMGEARSAAPDFATEATLAPQPLKRLATLFPLLPKPLGTDTEECKLPTGQWQARCIQKTPWYAPWRRPYKREFGFRVDECMTGLKTLMPRGEPDFRLVRANAWDGSGLAWEWRGRIESVHIEVQLRSLGSGNRYLGLVHREGRFAGWFEVQAPGEAAED
jgi:cholesterol oxidase